MDIDSLTDDDLDQLASQLAGRLPTGRHGNRFVLSRRQLLSVAGGSAGVAGLVALGVEPAAAQSAAGQVGTSSDPVDVEAYDLNVANLLNGGGPLADGDGTERQIYVIANGASDPSDADPEDIIFEEQA
jgi:hypothetical protein